MKTTITTLLAIVLFNYTTATAQVIEQDSLALVAFYNSTGGSNWNNNSGWLTGPVSTWYGVTVEGDRVAKLHLYSNNLIGEIPDEIGLLTQIKLFVIGNEPGIIGLIPDTIYQLTELTNLGIGNLTKLLSLNFLGNNLTGTIPSELGNLDSLVFLNLHENQLTGPIPPELGNCTNLWELWLNDNQLTGTIPEEITWLDKLEVLNLSSNRLSGKLPEYLSNLFYQIFPNCIDLDVSNNMFRGPVPNSWGNLSILIASLDLSYNNFTSLPQVNYNWCMTFFHIEGNKLTFEHIESHYQSYQAGLYYFFYYAPQQFMCEEIDTLLPTGSDYWIYSGTAGEYTNYEWYHNQQLIQQGPGLDTLFLENISYADTGIYYCDATNSLVNGLSLRRNNVYVGIDTGAQIINNYNKSNLPVIYPNPASEKITILLPFKSEPVSLRIFNLEGRCILSQQHAHISNSKIISGIEGFRSGIYLLQVQLENKFYTTKLIISKQGTNR